jgi:hypothetical protein
MLRTNNFRGAVVILVVQAQQRIHACPQVLRVSAGNRQPSNKHILSMGLVYALCVK